MCKYQLNFPSDRSTHCMAYSWSKRPDGLHWAHYPCCEDSNCPIQHPELLEGAVLDTKDADIAQSVEQRICNPQVVGSSPTVSSNLE